MSDIYSHEALYLATAYPPTVLFAKLSLFILYLRLFSLSRSTRVMSWIGIVACLIFYLFGGIFSLVICSPWHNETRFEALASKRCAMVFRYGYATIAFNAISDFYIMFIPIPVVRKLNMSTTKKIQVLSIFSLGFL